jgi:lipopolysaccharide assembly protein A
MRVAQHMAGCSMNFKLLLSVLLAGLALVFVIQNARVVEIRFLFWSLTISGSLLLFLVLVIGLVIGWLWHSFSSHRRKKHGSASDTA